MVKLTRNVGVLYKPTKINLSRPEKLFGRISAVEIYIRMSRQNIKSDPEK